MAVLKEIEELKRQTKSCLLALLLLVAAAGGCSLVESPDSGDLPGTRADVVEAPYNFSRSHPSIIKGLLDPGAENIDALLGGELGSVKALGVNTIYIYVDYSYDNVEFVLTPHSLLRGESLGDEQKERGYAEQIRKAKESGFAVHLATSFGGGANRPFNVPLERFLVDARAANLKWAKRAEEYQLESYAPSSEIDFQVFREYYGANWSDRQGFGEAVAVSNRYHDDVLPVIM